LNGNNITIHYDFYTNENNIKDYDSTYDAVIYWNLSNLLASNANTVLNQYYINGKGVILGLFTNYNNFDFIRISNYNISSSTYVANLFIQNESNIIFKNINSVYLYNYVILTSLNNSIGLGTLPSNNKLLYYLDSNNLNGRRVDLNIYPLGSSIDSNIDTPKLIL
jgi:hypothetical protein